MLPELTSALAALAERLTTLARQDAPLRAELRRLAAAILTATAEEPPAETSPLPETHIVAPPPAPSTLAPVSPPVSVAADLPPAPAVALTVNPTPVADANGSSTAPAPAEEQRAALTRRLPPSDSDLPLIELRCRLKAEAARWALTRRRLMSSGANFREEIDPHDRGLIARAKTLPNCFLWMSHVNSPAPADLSLFEEVAGCYEATAEAIVLIKAILDENPDTHQGELEQALDLLAESQSALRAAVAHIDGPTDTDQFEVFNWIKAYAYENQVYIKRYMRVDDPADPSRWAATIQRIKAVGLKLDETHRRAKQRKKLFGKVRHKASQIAKEPATAADQWPSLAQVVDELVNDGLPPSNRELRDLLLPVIDLVPDDLDEPRGLQLVTREIDRYLATCPPVETTVAVQEPTAEVRRAARLLGGRSLVLIGGVRRPGADDALKRTLGLRELYWIETREHQSIDSFEPVIARSDVAAVVLAIRWSSHSFGDVKEFCDRYDKPLVRLPAGYNPNQVAVQIEAQCSERLKAGDGARA